MKKNSLQFELSLKISIFFLFFIIGVSSAIIIYMSNQYNKIILENLHGNMENMVDSVEYYFEDVKTPMVMLARNDNILSAIKNYQNMTNRERLETINALDDFVQNITSFKSFINDIIIVGANGYIYNIYNNNQSKYLNNFDFLESEYLQNAVKGNVKLYYVGQHTTEYYIHQMQDKRVYSVILPIRNGKSKSGYIICDLKASIINEIMENNLKDNKAKIIIQGEEGDILFEEGNENIKSKEVLNKEQEEIYRDKNIFEILFAQDNYIARVKSGITGWTFIYAEPYTNFNGFVKQVFFFSIGIMLIGLTVIIFFSRQLSKQILKPFKNIAFMIHEMEINQGIQKERAFYLKGQNAKELTIEIEHMIQKMDHLIKENYLYELKAKDAQIEVLVNQLSPHFLYNTLQLIEYQSYADNKENVTRIINGLSYILRYSIKSNKTVCLIEELHYIEYYLEIYSLRYQNKLQYEIFVEQETKNAVIPKMILEPMAENSLKHGFSDSFNHARITVKISKKNRDLFISIEDNGKGINKNDLTNLQNRLESSAIVQEHIGLNNVNAIIRLRYGEPYGVVIDSVEGEYTKVNIRLPFINFEGLQNETGGKELE